MQVLSGLIMVGFAVMILAAIWMKLHKYGGDIIDCRNNRNRSSIWYSFCTCHVAF